MRGSPEPGSPVSQGSCFLQLGVVVGSVLAQPAVVEQGVCLRGSLGKPG